MMSDRKAYQREYYRRKKEERQAYFKEYYEKFKTRSVRWYLLKIQV